MLRPVILSVLFFIAGLAAPAAAQTDNLDTIARDYVSLQLEIGARDDGYIDAYYGPSAIRTAATANPRSVAQLARAVGELQARLRSVTPAAGLPRQRKAFLDAQLTAAATRLRMLGGERLSFAEEAQGLYGVNLEGLLHPLEHYDPMLARIEQLVPGNGPLADRVEAFLARFTIPHERLDAVMRAAIAECRRRTVAYMPLPRGEAFTLEFVTNQPWSGYNWYQGDYRSLIQVNTDQPVRLSRAVDLGCHEGYPGHHAYNVLLEQHLSRGLGWVEFQVYPLYSPQSLIAEGSANYGVRLAFPGGERLRYETRALYPLAGLPTRDAAAYLALQDAIDALSGARFTIARDFLEGRITRDQAIAFAQRYQLMTRARAEQSIRFTERYRAYVINYGLGRDIVAAWVERQGRTPRARWTAMRTLLSRPMLPVDLLPRATR